MQPADPQWYERVDSHGRWGVTPRCPGSHPSGKREPAIDSAKGESTIEGGGKVGVGDRPQELYLLPLAGGTAPRTGRGRMQVLSLHVGAAAPMVKSLGSTPDTPAPSVRWLTPFFGMRASRG